jgi:hypothetical protein
MRMILEVLSLVLILLGFAVMLAAVWKHEWWLYLAIAGNATVIAGVIISDGLTRYARRRTHGKHKSTPHAT